MPFRDYNEHDVINLFALNTANTKIGDSGAGDAGVIVAVANGALSSDIHSISANDYLGKSDYPNVGRVGYPTLNTTVAAATTGAAALGITLFETAQYDENGEKLLYYKAKALENQVILSGQATPVVTKGTFTLDDSAFVGSIPAPGTSLVVGATAGKFDAYGATGAATVKVGKVLATGSRVAGLTADYFAGSAGSTGTYAIVRLNFDV